jgi:hypothetical protein
MAGAKQLRDNGFILVPAGAVRPAVVCSGHCIALHHGACRGGLQARRERRPSLHVPEVFRIEVSANIVVKAKSVRVNAICHPLRPGDCPSFYRLRRGQFTGMPHCFIYVWRHDIQCRGVDGRPGESCFWRDVMACHVSVQERLRGWRCSGRSFGGRPHADSRVPLTGGRTRHNSERGDVPSSRASTASRMVMQWPGWCCDGGDGRTGPTATEVTGPAGLTSRRSPGQAWNRRSSPLRGFRRPLSRARRVSRMRVGGTVSRD